MTSGLLVAFAAPFISSCHSDRIGAPISLSTGLAIKPGESGDLVLADTAGIIHGRVALGAITALGSAQSPDRMFLYLIVVHASARRELVAIEPGKGRVSWRESVTGQAETRVISGVEIWGSDLITVTPNGGALLFSYARHGGTVGIASLDLPTRSSAMFAGPRTTTAEIAAPTLGSLRLSLDETNLLLSEPGTGVDFGGSGHVHVFTAANLDGRGTIALPLGEGGYPRPSWGAAPGLEPSVMYLVTGTSRFCPFPTPQESAVITLDLVLMRVVRVTELSDLGSSTVFVF